MNFLNPVFLIPIITGPILIVTGWILKKYPPKEINGLYGYRTKNSMSSQERWNFAQDYSAKQMVQLGIILSACSILGLFIEPEEGAGTLIGLGLMIITFIVMLVRTEKALKLQFGKE